MVPTIDALSLHFTRIKLASSHRLLQTRKLAFHSFTKLVGNNFLSFSVLIPFLYVTAREIILCCYKMFVLFTYMKSHDINADRRCKLNLITSPTE